MRRLLTFASAAAVVAGTAAITGSAASTPASPQTQVRSQVDDLIRQLLETTPRGIATPMARTAIEEAAFGVDPSDPRSIAGGHRRAPHGLVGSDPIQAQAVTADAAAPAGPGLPNVRVNNPAEDSHIVDQSTQSETSIAVAGSNVVVGFNDSQNGLLSFTGADTNLTGVAASHDGGKTFTDGGVVPNAGGYLNFGDPWLASDASGTFYYSTLMLDYRGPFDIVIGVSRSTDGGRTWTDPVNASLALETSAKYQVEIGDKPALVSAPSGLYVAWDDFTIGTVNGYNALFNGVAVAHSTDGGKTWKASYASNKPLLNGAVGACGKYIIGAQPMVAADGSVSVAAEQFSFCGRNGKLHNNIMVFSSGDQGATWSQSASLDIVSSTAGQGTFLLGAGQYMRNDEFPTVAVHNGVEYMAWNDGGDGSGHSHIRLALSANGGHSWSTSFITSGTNDEAQPSITADSTGVHILYYEASGVRPGCTFAFGCGGEDADGQLDVMVANSPDGFTWTQRRVSTQSFPGVYTLPNFDPFIAWTYMGDYTGIATDGTHQYMAWGDNRDMVTNWVWPQGRHDPNVYFARQDTP